MTSSDFRDKGEPENEKSKKSLKAVDKPEEVIHKSPGYFKFPKWEYQKWNQVKKDFGEGHTPIDKMEGEYKIFFNGLTYLKYHVYKYYLYHNQNLIIQFQVHCSVRNAPNIAIHVILKTFL